MRRRTFAIVTLAVLAALPGIASRARGADSVLEPGSRPNVLFLFADDLTFEAIGALDRIDIETPNLDRLMRRGTSFLHAYNMGSWSGAVCVASRCMLITGRTLWDANRIYAQTDAERQAGRFWPSYMKQAGYETYFTGKWHIRTSAELSFDVVRHVRPGMPNQTEIGYDRPIIGQADPWSPFDRSLGGYWKGGTHWSVVTANDAVDYLDRAKDREAPFFMYVAFNAPHDPRQSPRAFVEKYPLDRVDLPENYLPLYPYKDSIGCGPGLRDERLAPFPRTEYAVKVHRGEYYAIITHLDDQIGRVLDALEATDQADSTLIVFSADHGLAVGHHGLFGKQNMYDHSVRVPFLVAGPGVEAGRTIEAPIYLQDIMPTTLELAGVPVPDHVGFQSLLPLLRGESSASSYDAIYGAYLDLQRSITRDGYKLILYPKAPAIRLYHLTDDPEEKNDLSSDPEQADRLADLFDALRRLQDELGDDLDLPPVFGEVIQGAGR